MGRLLPLLAVFGGNLEERGDAGPVACPLFLTPVAFRMVQAGAVPGGWRKTGGRGLLPSHVARFTRLLECSDAT